MRQMLLSSLRIRLSQPAPAFSVPVTSDCIEDLIELNPSFLKVWTGQGTSLP